MELNCFHTILRTPKSSQRATSTWNLCRHISIPRQSNAIQERKRNRRSGDATACMKTRKNENRCVLSYK
jgi:hypothetical protein